MRGASRLGVAVGLGAIFLGVGAGCTVSIQPWTKPAPGPVPSATMHDLISGNPAHPGAPRPIPGETPNEGMAIWLKQMRETEDQRRGLVDQAVYLKKELREREETMSRAAGELEMAKKDLKRVRDDMQASQAELDALRERVRRLEDNRASLKPLLDQILQQLDRDREPQMFKLQK